MGPFIVRINQIPTPDSLVKNAVASLQQRVAAKFRENVQKKGSHKPQTIIIGPLCLQRTLYDVTHTTVRPTMWSVVSRPVPSHVASRSHSVGGSGGRTDGEDGERARLCGLHKRPVRERWFTPVCRGTTGRREKNKRHNNDAGCVCACVRAVGLFPVRRDAVRRERPPLRAGPKILEDGWCPRDHPTGGVPPG